MANSFYNEKTRGLSIQGFLNGVGTTVIHTAKFGMSVITWPV
ncbi:hypothetical protein AYI69_g10726, partial [Smittium culicis]